MSVSVSQILNLPSLKKAVVLAGHKSLTRIVTSVSVLEYSTPSDMQQQLFDCIEFGGSELVLTGFCSIANDVEAQCATVQRLAAAGEVGLVLYYVGIFVPEVNQQLIDTCNRLNFILICMPENDPTLRYSEVIQEVMDAVFTDQRNVHSFSVDVLEEMSRLPKLQQTAKNLLRVISDRLRSSVVIANSEYQVLSVAPWPRNQDLKWNFLLDTARQYVGKESVFTLPDHPSVLIYSADIRMIGNESMILLIASENGELEESTWEQAKESVRIGMGFFGKEHDRVDMAELVRSILMDDPIKMRRLGALYHIDVKALSDTWILRNTENENLSSHLEKILSFLSQYTKVELYAEYNNDIILFPNSISSLRDQDEVAQALVGFLAEEKISAWLTRCPAMQSTSDVKYAYELNTMYLKDAMVIFPSRTMFSISEIEFAKECKEIASSGQNSVSFYTATLNRILEKRDGAEILDTLASFLLDQNLSITDTANALYVHKNTIKYRLRKAGDLLGFRIGNILQSKKLIYAVALLRLLSRTEQ